MAVPHYYQSSPQTCGAACLRMLCAAFWQSFDEATVAQKCDTTASGCMVQDLEFGAQALGFHAGLLRVLDESEAIAALTDQPPFVAMIDRATLLNVLPML